jgi:hypothetical protein
MVSTETVMRMAEHTPCPVAALPLAALLRAAAAALGDTVDGLLAAEGGSRHRTEAGITLSGTG